jgi:hypothetical protein
MKKVKHTLEEINKEQEERVEHPSHYRQNKLGIEVIDIVRDLPFNLGNVIKYTLRAGYKKEEGLTDSEKKLEDFKKARFYLNDAIIQLENDIKNNKL